MLRKSLYIIIWVKEKKNLIHASCSNCISTLSVKGMVTELCSGPCMVLEINGTNTPQAFREFCGPADPVSPILLKFITSVNSTPDSCPKRKISVLFKCGDDQFTVFKMMMPLEHVKKCQIIQHTFSCRFTQPQPCSKPTITPSVFEVVCVCECRAGAASHAAHTLRQSESLAEFISYNMRSVRDTSAEESLIPAAGSHKTEKPRAWNVTHTCSDKINTWWIGWCPCSVHIGTMRLYRRVGLWNELLCCDSFAARANIKWGTAHLG